MTRSALRRRRAGAWRAAAAAATVVAAAVSLLALPGTLPADLQVVAPLQPPALAHPLGTDDLGRDVATTVLLGLRTSLLLGTGATLLAQALGIAVGLAAALGPAWRDELLMRAAEVVASLPTLVVAILVAAVHGGSVTALALVLGLSRWPLIARLVRVEAASLRTREFVVAARALGASPLRVALVHVLPHAITPALAATGILFGGAVVAEAALAFVGLGDPAVASLGQLAASGFAFVHHAPWVWLAPVAAIVVLTALLAGVAEREP